MPLFDMHEPFFRPIWRRITVTSICLLWAAFEFATGSPFWGVIFAALGLYAFWQFFLVPWPEEGGDDGEENE